MAKNYQTRVANSTNAAHSVHQTSTPLVSVLITTFNRPRYFHQALASVLNQSYGNLQIIIVNDGGRDVSDIVNSFADQRIIFINRKQNRGKAFSLNEALTRAQGKYIAYLDDDDLYYPNHIETLVNALENQTACQVAYSDLYKTYCRIDTDGSRQVLSKVVEISRDFDRFLMLHFNHALHVSLMHRRDLIEKTGLYNEDLTILIDWDMTRRLVFFSDFHHVYEITGEFYTPIGESDRISVQRRKDKTEYLRNILAIRTTRPPKPWPKIDDMSIIFVTDRLNRQAGQTIGSIWQHTFYPYKLYLPVPQADLEGLNTNMPNIVHVPVDSLSDHVHWIDIALAKCEGEFIVIVPGGFPIRDMWVEEPLYALINGSSDCKGFELEGSTDSLWAAVFRKDDLLYARSSFPNLPLRESLRAAGIVLTTLSPEEIPFKFDRLLEEAQLAEKNGNWAQAAQIFEYIADHHRNELWMKSSAAKAYFEAGCCERAARLSSEVNCRRPAVDTLLLEAKVHRQTKNFNSAIELLKTAKRILEGSELLWT